MDLKSDFKQFFNQSYVLNYSFVRGVKEFRLKENIENVIKCD